MNLSGAITRRKFFKTAGAGASASVFSASVFLKTADANVQEEWRLVSVFSKGHLLSSQLEPFAKNVAEASGGSLKIKIYYRRRTCSAS